MVELNEVLALAEKAVYSPVDGPEAIPILKLPPERICLQVGTEQMADIQFMASARFSVPMPSTMHCDDLISANNSAEEDI